MSLKLSIIACGGFGTNVVRALDPIDGVSIHRFDTSLANKFGDEEINLIGNGEGSGKIRAANAEITQKHLTGHDLERISGQLNIVVFSLTGGSGSVIGPLMIRELEKHGHKTVAIVVTDSGSEVEINNASKTLQTLVAITSQNKIYLPIASFSNTGVGRTVVNGSVVTTINKLMNLATEPTIELDVADRMAFFNPTTAVAGATPGLKPLIIKTGDDEYNEPLKGQIESFEDDEIMDALLMIAGSGDVDGAVNPMRKECKFAARVAFDGIYSNIKRVPYVAMIQSHDGALQSVLDNISQRQSQFQSQSARASVVTVDASSIANGGLVL